MDVQTSAVFADQNIYITKATFRLSYNGFNATDCSSLILPQLKENNT